MLVFPNARVFVLFVSQRVTLNLPHDRLPRLSVLKFVHYASFNIIATNIDPHLLVCSQTLLRWNMSFLRCSSWHLPVNWCTWSPRYHLFRCASWNGLVFRGAEAKNQCGQRRRSFMLGMRLSLVINCPSAYMNLFESKFNFLMSQSCIAASVWTWSCLSNDMYNSWSADLMVQWSPTLSKIH